MSFRQLVDDFVGSVGAAATRAPDDYPSWSSATYEWHMLDIRELWAQVHPKVKNRDVVLFVQERLDAMFSAFERGEKTLGRAAAWDIYNFGAGKIR